MGEVLERWVALTGELAAARRTPRDRAPGARRPCRDARRRVARLVATSGGRRARRAAARNRARRHRGRLCPGLHRPSGGRHCGRAFGMARDGGERHRTRHRATRAIGHSGARTLAALRTVDLRQLLRGLPRRVRAADGACRSPSDAGRSARADRRTLLARRASRRSLSAPRARAATTIDSSRTAAATLVASSE